MSTIDVKPALCLDLDGTVRYSKSGKFIQRIADIELYEGVEETLWEMRQEGWLIFGISNQGGVAHGFKTPEEIDRELTRTMEIFETSPFHSVKTCFHMDDGSVSPYKWRSLMRKPDIGMLALLEMEALEKGFMVDWNNSVLVGDREEDRQCAHNAGIRFSWAWDFFGRPAPNKDS